MGCLQFKIHITVFLKNIVSSKTIQNEVLPQILCRTVIFCFNVS